MTKRLLATIFATALLTAPGFSSANEVEPIYGNQLMTQEEMQPHREAMRNAKTPEERALIRERNHEKMRLRAKEKGVPFPDTPPAERGRMNQKNAPGMGKNMPN